jgi:hypothetical protein
MGEAYQIRDQEFFLLTRAYLTTEAGLLRI